MGERILQQNLELRQGRFGAGEPEGTPQGRAQRRIVVLLEQALRFSASESCASAPYPSH